MKLRFFISLVGILLLCQGSALAQESKEPKEGEESKKAEIKPSISLEGYIPIQLKPLTLPVMSPDGGLAQGTISMFVIVRGQRNVTAFCRYLPRVREAITLTVDRIPVPVVKGKYQLKDTGERLHKAINRFLPSPLVVKLHLLAGPRIVGKGAIDLELPGTDENCMSIKEIPAEVLAMVKAQNAESKSVSVSRFTPRRKQSRKSVTRNLEPVSRQPRPRYTPPSVTVKARKSDALTEETPDPGKCKKMNELWSAGFHQIAGRQYWLGQAFTLDDNNDDVVDNVGFLLKSEGRPDVYIYYFPGPGLQSVITVPSLRLANDREARMACAGQVEFNKPSGDGPSSRKMAGAAESAKTPTSASRFQTRGNGKKEKQSSSSGFFDGPGLYFVIAAGVGVLLIVFAGIYFSLSKRKAERRRNERRQRRNRRKQDRRQSQQPLDGEDQRKTGERRKETPERRKEDNRQEEAAPEVTSEEDPDKEEKGD